MNHTQKMQKLRSVIEKGCGCGKNCISTFSFLDIREHIISFFEMTKNEKEFYTMAKLEAKRKRSQLKDGDSTQKRFRYSYQFKDVRGLPTNVFGNSQHWRIYFQSVGTTSNDKRAGFQNS